MAESAAALGNPGYGWPRPPAPTTSEPIIILTFSHSGAEILTEALARSALLACTARTGVLPLCEAVASTWQRVERRQHLSALAIASIRSLVTSMAIARTLESGALRWCETATSGAGSAATFLKIFPKTKFICFHRRADEVIEEAIANNPWGFGKTEFWPYSSAEPGNSLLDRRRSRQSGVTGSLALRGK